MLKVERPQVKDDILGVRSSGRVTEVGETKYGRMTAYV